MSPDVHFASRIGHAKNYPAQDTEPLGPEFAQAAAVISKIKTLPVNQGQYAAHLSCVNILGLESQRQSHLFFPSTPVLNFLNRRKGAIRCGGLSAKCNGFPEAKKESFPFLRADVKLRPEKMESNVRQSLQRIALVSGGVPAGGSTTFLINFAGELVRRGVPVEVLSFEPENPLAADFQKQNISVTGMDRRRMIFEDRLKIILQNLARFRPTVVVSTLGAVSFEVLRYLPPGIFRIGMGQSDDPIVYDMMRHYAPWMDLAAMVSKTMAQKAAAMPEFARVPVAYLPYGVPMSPEGKTAQTGLQRPLQILYLGRLGREQKRVHLFLEIFSQLCASGMPFHWTIAGEGEERGFLEAGLKPPSPAQTVSFAGQTPYARVPELLQAHDVFLLASNYEGLPLSLLEAMGAGLVPVVSDLPSGIPEVVDAGNGMLVPVDDVAGYARAIIHLHGHRDELAAKSAAARARVKTEFSVPAMADRWLAAFPPTKVAIGPWPKRWRIQAPLPERRPVYFSPPVRALRRLAARLRQ
jgi:glycosyltransferase involved in cell wall biosynthesis